MSSSYYIIIFIVIIVITGYYTIFVYSCNSALAGCKWVFIKTKYPLFISRRRVYFPWVRINWIKEELSNYDKDFIISWDLLKAVSIKLKQRYGKYKKGFTWLNQRDWFFQLRFFYRFSRDASEILPLRWLDWIFWGWYLPSLSINYVSMSKDIEKRLPQLYYIKMKISYDLGFIAIGVAMAT